jgi:transcriptional regulator with XRE-family HTH domain
MPTIKQLRKQRHWTQAELALRIDVSPSTVSAWERGRRQPTERQLNALATIFGIDNQAIGLIEQHEPPMSRQEIPAAFTIRIWHEENAWFALWEATSGTTPGYHERGETPAEAVQRLLTALVEYHTFLRSEPLEVGSLEAHQLQQLNRWNHPSQVPARGPLTSWCSTSSVALQPLPNGGRQNP